MVEVQQEPEPNALNEARHHVTSCFNIDMITLRVCALITNCNHNHNQILVIRVIVITTKKCNLIKID